MAEANLLALKAGFNYGEITELFTEQYHVPKAKLPPGKYRKITGNEALAMGLIAASKLSGKQLVYCSYPITPASDILHNLAAEKHFGVLTFQAEDEIAAVGAAIGASFGGALGVTGTSGPGIALKSEGMALAVMTELAAGGHRCSARRAKHRACRPRPSRRICSRFCSGATANARCR